MGTNSVQYSFGPVPSRRLQKSIGINTIPAKVCSYSCVYCQVGRTTEMEDSRRSFYKPGDIFQDVQRRVTQAAAQSERVDYLTFVPDGEPTLDVNLGKEIILLKTLGIPVGVITNSSLLWRDDVRNELSKADWVSLKIDAGLKTPWLRINRPHKTIRLPLILEGIEAFAKDFTGTLVTETMLVRGVNDTDDNLKAVAECIGKVQPHRAYLSIPTRPPAEQLVRCPDEQTLNRAYHIFADKVPRVEFLIGYEGDSFAFTGDVERDLLSVTAVHPMREEAVQALVARAGSSWEIIDRLIAREEITTTEHDGHLFYLRKFIKDRTR
jgi:wyosine [tRNA(Phe)-imidazoG37] synthetase (radical SAM superfamily)